MRFLTDFADLAVLLPLALSVALWLAASGAGRLAARFVLILGALLAALALLKLALLGCGNTLGLGSPSGHTASATYVYGAAAALVLRPRLPAVLLAGLAIAALFGASRLALRVHSLADVAVGAAAGLAALACLARAPVPAGLRPIRLAACLPLLLALHGTRLDAEPHLRGAGTWLGLSLCPAAPAPRHAIRIRNEPTRRARAAFIKLASFHKMIDPPAPFT